MRWCLGKARRRPQEVKNLQRRVDGGRDSVRCGASVWDSGSRRQQSVGGDGGDGMVFHSCRDSPGNGRHDRHPPKPTSLATSSRRAVQSLERAWPLTALTQPLSAYVDHDPRTTTCWAMVEFLFPLATSAPRWPCGCGRVGPASASEWSIVRQVPERSLAAGPVPEGCGTPPCPVVAAAHRPGGVHVCHCLCCCWCGHHRRCAHSLFLPWVPSPTSPPFLFSIFPNPVILLVTASSLSFPASLFIFFPSVTLLIVSSQFGVRHSFRHHYIPSAQPASIDRYHLDVPHQPTLAS